MVLLYMLTLIGGILMGSMLTYIAAPWILWVWILGDCNRPPIDWSVYCRPPMLITPPVSAGFLSFSSHETTPVAADAPGISCPTYNTWRVRFSLCCCALAARWWMGWLGWGHWSCETGVLLLGCMWLTNKHWRPNSKTNLTPMSHGGMVTGAELGFELNHNHRKLV